MLELRRLSVDDGPGIYRMLQEIPKEENGFGNNANGISYEAYKEWLAAKHQESIRDGIRDGWKVPTTTYWLYADGIPVGIGKLRHCLTDALRKAGGHIGYAIAPAYRGKGYGKELLRLLLQKAKEMGIEKVLVTIRLNNTASQAVAFANGGVVTDRTDERLLIWIDVMEPEEKSLFSYIHPEERRTKPWNTEMYGTFFPESDVPGQTHPEKQHLNTMVLQIGKAIRR